MGRYLQLRLVGRTTFCCDLRTVQLGSFIPAPYSYDSLKVKFGSDGRRGRRIVGM